MGSHCAGRPDYHHPRWPWSSGVSSGLPGPCTVNLSLSLLLQTGLSGRGSLCASPTEGRGVGSPPSGWRTTWSSDLGDFSVLAGSFPQLGARIWVATTQHDLVLLLRWFQGGHRAPFSCPPVLDTRPPSFSLGAPGSPRVLPAPGCRPAIAPGSPVPLPGDGVRGQGRGADLAPLLGPPLRKQGHVCTRVPSCGHAHL